MDLDLSSVITEIVNDETGTDATRVLVALELSGSPPEVRFDHVTATEGIQLIERSRGSPVVRRLDKP